jgi:large subunit ribosomal protein L21
VYAIIKSGGRQLKVAPGQVVEVDRIGFAPGDEVTISEVLLVVRDGGEIAAGAPFVANARVVGVVEGESRGPKIRIFKKRRRKGFRKSGGHRSTMTRVRIKEIQ